MIRRIAITAALLACGAPQIAAQQCEYSHNREVIDLSPLTKTSEQDGYYEVNSTQYTVYMFLFNICGPIIWQDYASPNVCPSGATGSCEVQTVGDTQLVSENYGASSGYSITHQDGENGQPAGPVLTMNASECSRLQDGTKVQTKIYLVCDEAATTPVVTEIKDSYWECYVHIQMRTSLICSHGPGRPTIPPGGHTRPDFCNGACTGTQECHGNMTLPDCAAWAQRCRAAEGRSCPAPPADCFHCAARAADPCGNMCSRRDQPSGSTFCGWNITAGNKATCCRSRIPGHGSHAPAGCFGCFSRANPPPSGAHCDAPTPGPGQTTRPPVARCGDLEIDDAESCDKFCADPNNHEGVPENGKWTPDPDGAGRRKATCCCYAPGTQRPSTCCVDTDHNPFTQPPASECSITGPCAQKGFTVLRNASFLDACKKQTFDCDFDAPPGTPEFENCEAVETFIRAAYGSTGPGSFGDCCQCLKNSLTDLGVAQLIQQLYPQAYLSIIAEINSIDCDDNDADGD